MSGFKEESECQVLQNKLNELQSKYNMLNESFIQQQQEKQNVIDNLSNKNFLVFPTVDRIPSEKIYDAYTHLYEAYQNLSKEKEFVLASLKTEILSNDQQRNYIEILKQTIESSLIKTGLKPKIESQLNSDKDFYTTVIQITDLQNEIDKLKADNNNLEIITEKLKNEVEFCNKNNAQFKEKIQDSLESGMKELEEAKAKIKFLENDKENLIHQLVEVNDYNERLKNVVQKFESENNETTSKIIKMQKNFEEKIKEQVDNCTKVKEENLKLTQMKNDLVQNNENLKENKTIIDEKFDGLKKQNDALTKEIFNLKEINSQLEEEKKAGEISAKNCQNQILELQKLNDEIASENKNLKLNLNSASESNTKLINENGYLHSQINNLTGQLSQMQGSLSNEALQNIKIAIYNCLNASNVFLQSCRNITPINDNRAMLDLIDSINSITSKFEMCYQAISSGKQFINFENLIKEIKSFKADNKKLYEMNKTLNEENANNFYVNKENKFFHKFVARILKYHMQNIDIKNILNQILLLNDKAICLEIDKNKIETKIDSLSYSKENNSQEINKCQMLIKDIEMEIKEKFVQLKGLDNKLKQFEKTIN